MLSFIILAIREEGVHAFFVDPPTPSAGSTASVAETVSPDTDWNGISSRRKLPPDGTDNSFFPPRRIEPILEDEKNIISEPLKRRKTISDIAETKAPELNEPASTPVSTENLSTQQVNVSESVSTPAENVVATTQVVSSENVPKSNAPEPNSVSEIIPAVSAENVSVSESVVETAAPASSDNISASEPAAETVLVASSENVSASTQSPPDKNQEKIEPAVTTPVLNQKSEEDTLATLANASAALKESINSTPVAAESTIPAKPVDLPGNEIPEIPEKYTTSPPLDCEMFNLLHGDCTHHADDVNCTCNDGYELIGRYPECDKELKQWTRIPQCYQSSEYEENIIYGTFISLTIPFSRKSVLEKPDTPEDQQPLALLLHDLFGKPGTVRYLLLGDIYHEDSFTLFFRARGTINKSQKQHEENRLRDLLKETLQLTERPTVSLYIGSTGQFMSPSSWEENLVISSPGRPSNAPTCLAILVLVIIMVILLFSRDAKTRQRIKRHFVAPSVHGRLLQDTGEEDDNTFQLLQN